MLGGAESGATYMKWKLCLLGEYALSIINRIDWLSFSVWCVSEWVSETGTCLATGKFVLILDIDSIFGQSVWFWYLWPRQWDEYCALIYLRFHIGWRTPSYLLDIRPRATHIHSTRTHVIRLSGRWMMIAKC